MMNYSEAEAAIIAILADVHDDALPEPSQVESRPGEQFGPTIWFGGKGYVAGSARDGNGASLTGTDHRRKDAAYEAMCLERVHRTEVALAHESIVTDANLDIATERLRPYVLREREDAKGQP